ESNCRAVHAIADDAVAELTAPLYAKVGPVIAHHQIAQRPLGVVHLGLEEIALRNHREVQAQAGTHNPAPFVAGMPGCGQAVTITAGERSRPKGAEVARHERPSVGANGVRAAEVCGIDLMGRGHDLGAAPGLVEADIADDIGRLNAAVAGAIGRSHSSECAAATDGSSPCAVCG